MQLPKSVYMQNEICYINLPGQPANRLYRGRVCGQLTEPGVTGTYYVIKLDNFTWPYFEIRDSHLMCENADGILPSADKIFNPDLRTPTANEEPHS